MFHCIIEACIVFQESIYLFYKVPWEYWIYSVSDSRIPYVRIYMVRRQKGFGWKNIHGKSIVVEAELGWRETADPSKYMSDNLHNVRTRQDSLSKDPSSRLRQRKGSAD